MKGVGIILMVLLAGLIVLFDSVSYILSIFIDGILVGLLVAVALWLIKQSGKTPAE